MEALGANFTKSQYPVFSHDRIGGAATVLAGSPSMEAYAHDAVSEKTLGLIWSHTEPRDIREWTEIADGIAVTGPLVVTTPNGYPVVTGCAHPHISRIVERGQ